MDTSDKTVLVTGLQRALSDDIPEVVFDDLIWLHEEDIAVTFIPRLVAISSPTLKRLLGTKHTDRMNLEFNQHLKFVDTLLYPEYWEDLHDNGKIALYRFDEKVLNKVVLKLVPADNKTYFLSSYLTNRQRNIKKWLKTSRKISHLPCGATRPTSPIGEGGRLFPSSGDTV